MVGNIEEAFAYVHCNQESTVVCLVKAFESSSQISVYVLSETCKHFGDILPFIK